MIKFESTHPEISDPPMLMIQTASTLFQQIIDYLASPISAESVANAMVKDGTLLITKGRSTVASLLHLQDILAFLVAISDFQVVKAAINTTRQYIWKNGNFLGY